MVAALDNRADSLYRLFEITNKSELEKHCREAVIYQRDLANLIIATKHPDSPVKHVQVFRKIEPEHLRLTEADHAAMANHSGGPHSKLTKKVANKIFEMIGARRLMAGHMFNMPMPEIDHWIFLHFSNRDLSEMSNHWIEGGPHLHLISYLTHPRLNPLDLLQEFECASKPRLPTALHIRYCRGEQAGGSI